MALAVVLVDRLNEVLREAVSSVIAGSRKPSNHQAVRLRPRPEEVSVNSYALLQAYALMAVTGLGYLALLWSTVVLLGGFVTSLGKKDFWCLASISMVQASRIFNDSGDQLFPILLNLADKLMDKVLANPIVSVHDLKKYSRFSCILIVVPIQTAHVIVQVLSLSVLLMFVTAIIIYILGPVTCIVLSAWRIGQRDYGDTRIDDSKRNLMPALDIFYSMVICQGMLFFLWWLIDYAAVWIVVSLREECKLPKEWGSTSLVEYLFDTQSKCWRDPASIDGVKLINYAVNLLDSGLQKDYLSGARMIDTFIKLEADVKSLLLPSRPKIQKLIDTLGWRSSDKEIKELAARIIAYLASDIHLTQFPGSVQCISSLLDSTTLPHWNNKQGPHRSKIEQGPHDHSRQSRSEKGPQQPKLARGLRFLLADRRLEEDLWHRLFKREPPLISPRRVQRRCGVFGGSHLRAAAARRVPAESTPSWRL